jgi:hypothetical protein
MSDWQDAPTSFDKTMELALELGYKVEQIDSDCVLLTKEEDHTQIQVIFNELMPTCPFWSALETSSHLKFHSYAGIRKFMLALDAEG